MRGRNKENFNKLTIMIIENDRKRFLDNAEEYFAIFNYLLKDELRWIEFAIILHMA